MDAQFSYWQLVHSHMTKLIDHKQGRQESKGALGKSFHVQIFQLINYSYGMVNWLMVLVLRVCTRQSISLY